MEKYKSYQKVNYKKPVHLPNKSHSNRNYGGSDFGFITVTILSTNQIHLFWKTNQSDPVPVVKGDQQKPQ